MRIEMEPCHEALNKNWALLTSTLNEVIFIEEGGALADCQIHNLAPSNGSGTAVDHRNPKFKGVYNTTESAYVVRLGMGPRNAPVDEFFTFSTQGVSVELTGSVFQRIVLAWLALLDSRSGPFSVEVSGVTAETRRAVRDIVERIETGTQLPDWLPGPVISELESPIHRPDDLDFRK